MGSAALFFSLRPTSALLSDINAELVETFIAVRDHPRAVFNRISKIAVGKESYYKLREIDPNTLPALDRAARFIFLNRFCFNGIYRTNLKGQFNVPYGGAKAGSIPDWPTFSKSAAVLKKMTIVCSDFEDVLVNHTKSGDFVYIDPPYAVNNRRIFRQYGPQTFGLDDINRLDEALQIIDKRGVHFLVSYALSREALGAFSRWDVSRMSTHRNVAGFAKHRRRAVEILATNTTQ